MFTVTTNAEQVASRLRNASSARLRRALRSAVMRTLRGAKKYAGTKVKEVYTINAGEVTSTIQLSAQDLSGTLKSSGPRNPLNKFQIRPRKRPRRPPPGGVFVQVVRGEGGFLRRAFLMSSGRVYERYGKPRYPIHHLKGPAAPQMLGSPRVGPFIEARMAERLGIEIDHALAAMGGGFL